MDGSFRTRNNEASLWIYHTLQSTLTKGIPGGTVREDT